MLFRSELVEEVLTHFIGAIDQVPPAFSACMVDGKRAYELARKGEEVELKAKQLVIDEIELLECRLDDPESYEEISASAGIAAAMLTRGNPLHSKYINKAIKGLLANVSEDGKVMNVSGGTAVMRDKEGYRGIPKAYIQGWGQGLALSFFATLLISDDIEKDGAL